MTAPVTGFLCPCGRNGFEARVDLARHIVEDHLVSPARAFVMAEMITTGRSLPAPDLAALAPLLVVEPPAPATTPPPEEEEEPPMPTGHPAGGPCKECGATGSRHRRACPRRAGRPPAAAPPAKKPVRAAPAPPQAPPVNGAKGLLTQKLREQLADLQAEQRVIERMLAGLGG